MPGSALRDPLFLGYAAGMALLLGASGLVLALLSRRAGPALAPVWTTWRSWTVMLPVFMGAAALGRGALVGLFTLLALLGLKEFARATGLYRDWGMTGAAYGGTLAAGILCLVRDPARGTPGWYGAFMGLPAFVVAGILLIPILRNRARGQLQATSLAILGFIYIGWMFGHLSLLSASRNALGYLLYLVTAVEVGDVAAFVFGRAFGRHPLRSVLSPAKTVEGALGALAVSLALPWLLGASLPAFGTAERILAGLIVGLGGVLGDLSLSVIKRDLGLKDMGAAIPGHGGVLDRVDSLICTAPLFLHMVRAFGHF